MKTKTIRFVLPVVLASLLSAQTFGYEVSTHAWMTNEAYFRSSLARTGAGSLRERLGFNRLERDAVFDSLSSTARDGECGNIGSDSDPLHCYYDNVSTDTGFFFRRDPYSVFEQELLFALAKMGNLKDSEGKTIVLQGDARDISAIGSVAFGLGGWLMRGAIREDDLAGALMKAHDNDPRGNFIRVFNHFWDPVHDLDLTDIVGCPQLTFAPQTCVSALEWATGLKDPLNATPSEDTARRQHSAVCRWFSRIRAARAFRCARCSRPAHSGRRATSA